MQPAESEAARDAERFGMDAGTVAALRARAGEQHDGLWPEHVEIVRAFLAVETQWRVTAWRRGLVFLGLDYAGARAGIEAAGIGVTPQLWAGLRVMEREAIAALNAGADR